MIALDANVLVRYVVEDDPGQSERAAACIEAAIDRGEMLFVSKIVVCELVWVLTAAYGFSRSDVSAVLEGLLKAEQLTFPNLDLLLGALAAFRHGPADFADYLILGQSRQAGCTTLVTFDRRFLEVSHTTEPEPGVE